MSSSSSASSHTSSCSPSSGSLASSLDDRLNAHPRDAAVALDRDAAAAATLDPRLHHVALAAPPHHLGAPLPHPEQQAQLISYEAYSLPVAPSCASAPYTELAQLTQLPESTEDALFAHANYSRRPPNPFSFDLTPPPPNTTPYSPPLPLVFSPSSATASGARSFGVEDASKPVLSQHPLTTYLSSLQPAEPVVRGVGMRDKICKKCRGRKPKIFLGLFRTF